MPIWVQDGIGAPVIVSDNGWLGLLEEAVYEVSGGVLGCLDGNQAAEAGRGQDRPI